MSVSTPEARSDHGNGLAPATPAPRGASARLGIIGGGQLARMLALAGIELGCEVRVVERQPLSPASHVATEALVGDWNDPSVLKDLAARCDITTLENEFVDGAALRLVEQAGHPLLPTAASICLTQDKLTQKEALQRAGLPLPRFRAVRTPEEVAQAGQDFGWPLVLKTRRNGYDGKGNHSLRSDSDIPNGWERLGGGKNELFVEAFFHFSKEIAVIVTLGRDGSSAIYPVVETIQQDHVCRVVKAPAEIPAEMARQASGLAVRAVEAVGGLGSFGVELFWAANGDWAINELAPRVHNSGHYTIEACECSQFENHVRAVLGWPLGSTRMVAPAAVMINLLGTRHAPGRPLGLERALRVPGAHLHLYGKATSGPGRKMGHVTALGGSIDEAFALADRAAREIYFGNA